MTGIGPVGQGLAVINDDCRIRERRKMRPTIVAVCYGLAVLSSATGAFAQRPGIWAEKMFEKLDQDFGVVAKGSEAKYRLKLTNKYPDPVHIADVRTKCSCATVKASTNTLAPGEEGYIEIVFDTTKFDRHKDTTMTVVFDRPQHAEVLIPIKAYINPDVSLTPGAIDFGAVAKGASTQRKVAITYNGRQGTAIQSLINKNKLLKAQLQEVGRNGPMIYYDLAVTLDPATPEGDLRDQMTLVTNDPVTPHISVLVEGRVEAPYGVITKLVDFGTVDPGARLDRIVVVRGQQDFDIEKIESEHTAGVFEVRLPKSPQRYHKLPLTLIAPKEPGVLREEFTITIKGSNETVTFKAQCNVKPVETPRQGPG